MKSGSGSVDEQHGRGLFGVDGDHGEAEGSTTGATGIPYVRGGKEGLTLDALATQEWRRTTRACEQRNTTIPEREESTVLK